MSRQRLDIYNRLYLFLYTWFFLLLGIATLRHLITMCNFADWDWIRLSTVLTSCVVSVLPEYISKLNPLSSAKYIIYIFCILKRFISDFTELMNFWHAICNVSLFGLVERFINFVIFLDTIPCFLLKFNIHVAPALNEIRSICFSLTSSTYCRRCKSWIIFFSSLVSLKFFRTYPEMRIYNSFSLLVSSFL